MDDELDPSCTSKWFDPHEPGEHRAGSKERIGYLVHQEWICGLVMVSNEERVKKFFGIGGVHSPLEKGHNVDLINSLDE